ncbi:MAG: hypothetical protein WDA07_00945 [Leucobacter sp.]
MKLFKLPTRIRAALARGPTARDVTTSARAPTPVPWRVERRCGGLVVVEHCGPNPLHSVRFALAGEGILGLSLPRTVLPGERVQVRVHAQGYGPAAEVSGGAADAMLVLRWFQPDGTELLWPIAL